MNVEPEVQPKAAPHCFLGWGVTGRERPRMDGKRRTPVLSAVAAWEGRSILPTKEFFIDRRVLLRAHSGVQDNLSSLATAIYAR